MTEPQGRDHLVERAARRLQSISPGLSGLLAEPGEQLPAGVPSIPEPVQAPSRPTPVPPIPEPAPRDTTQTAGPEIDLPSLQRAGLALGDPGRSRIMEEFRLIQGRVLRAVQANYDAGAKGANMVLITSAKPKEGKTFSSLHLADSIARHGGRQALLVDLDAEQSALSHLLGLQDRPGFWELPRSAGYAPKDLVVNTCISNLSVLPAGKSRDSHTSQNGAKGLLQALEMLSHSYANRILVLDAPPCLSTSDPSILASAIAQTVLVVQAEYTQQRELEASLELLQACPTVLLMLNKVKLYQSYTFGAYVDN